MACSKCGEERAPFGYYDTRYCAEHWLEHVDEAKGKRYWAKALPPSSGSPIYRNHIITDGLRREGFEVSIIDETAGGKVIAYCREEDSQRLLDALYTLDHYGKRVVDE